MLQISFLLQYVARYLNQLHTVEQGLDTLLRSLARGNEHHLGQVVVDVEEIVVESIVLFRVEHLSRGRFRVALEVILTLSISSRNEHGIRSSRLLQVLNDAAGHGADVGASVSANLSFVDADRRATSE